MKVILYNIIGGIIVAVSTVILSKLIRVFRNWKHKRIFGQDADPKGPFHLVYAKLTLPKVYDESGKKITHPYIKADNDVKDNRVGFSMENPVSSCEFRAAKYISALFSSYLRTNIMLSADVDVTSKLDLSFISIGGSYSNDKTRDALVNPSNRLIKMTDKTFLSVISNRPVVRIKNNFDYGLILKIKPKQFPKRVWIVCAGLGEWGSSGAAWFLANKWKEILKANSSLTKLFNPLGVFRCNDFAAIIKVEDKKDESAIMEYFFRLPEEVELAADEIEDKGFHQASSLSNSPSASSGSDSSSSNDITITT